jgi:hypothetical protein
VGLDREGWYDRTPGAFEDPGNLGPHDQTRSFDNSREAWIEWCSCPALNVRMGQVKVPTTRQLMTPPELQQFVDVSLASVWVGQGLPGYTDRPRDFGVLVHGAFGCDGALSYVLAVTNGDGADSVRNVLDDRTDDNLAYSARLNWAFLHPVGYEEGALRQMACTWYGEVGVWAVYFADRLDKPHASKGDVFEGGVDLALGYGGWSLTAAYSIEDVSDWPSSFGDEASSTSWLVQLGFLIPSTAWEVAARADGYDLELDGRDGDVLEYALAVNYYLNGHGNKLSLDVSFLETSGEVSGITDLYAGYDFVFRENSAILVRFQWQLAL